MRKPSDAAGFLHVGIEEDMESAPMSGETRGHAIKRRREALGIFTAREFERATERVGAKVPRASIAKAEGGSATDRIMIALETALDRLEEETGQNDAPQASADQPIKFTVHNVYGIGEVIVEGPAGTSDELVESLAKLLHRVREENEGRGR